MYRITGISTYSQKGKQSLKEGRLEATDMSRFYGLIEALVGNGSIQEFTCYLDAIVVIPIYAELMLSPTFHCVTY